MLQRALTADRGGAGGTLLGKQVAEAVEAVGEVVPRGEPLAGQLILAPDANEALLMPGLVPVVHSSAGDGLEETTRCVHGQKPHPSIQDVLNGEMLNADRLHLSVLSAASPPSFDFCQSDHLFPAPAVT